MQDRNYSGVGGLKALIQALAGVSSFTTEEDVNILDFVNRRASQAYNMSPSWSRYVVSSEGRDINAYTLSGATASTSTSVNQNYKFLGTNDGNVGTVGTNVYQGVTTTTVIIYKDSNNAWLVQTAASAAIQSDGRYRVTAGVTQFTEADTLKKDVLENVTTWTPRGGSDSLLVEPKNLIPYAETGKNTIGEFTRIHRKQAFYNNSALEYDFFVDATGANVLNIVSGTDSKAFVTYKKELALFTDTSTDIPGEFFHYLAHAAYADFLRMDGQHGKALAEEQVAQGYIDSQLEQIDIRNNNNSINHKFSTYVNRQSR
jgi:hypothetical protein